MRLSFAIFFRAAKTFTYSQTLMFAYAEILMILHGFNFADDKRIS